ncbi:MAG: FAD-dependent oxidoreductase, partial [Aquabacterium sp.]
GQADLRGAMRYTDALTDDSRLVIRVLQEAMLEGASARNHTQVESIERDDTSPLRLQNLQVRDQLDGAVVSLQARHVFNATGLWADRLSATPPVIRPQRGTHLFLDAGRLPVSDCLTFMHPRDGRPVFAFPWKGQTCIGTTDLDHQGNFNDEPFATSPEVDYLLEAVNHQMPQLHLHPADVQATMAGVRPIIASGKGRNPSRERRDHLVWQGQGVISVSGGKLTTFRQIALDALLAADLIDPTEHRRAHRDRRQRCFRHQPGTPAGLDHPLQGTPHGAALRTQLDWILQHEMVVNLDDLLLRRLRVGALQSALSPDQQDDIRAACQRWLGWSEAVWQAQWSRYSEVIATHYRLPAGLPRTALEAHPHG